MLEVGGRKFFLTVFGILIISVIPVVYSLLKIDSATTQIVVGAVAGGIASFSAANVLQEKFSNKPMTSIDTETLVVSKDTTKVGPQ